MSAQPRRDGQVIIGSPDVEAVWAGGSSLGSVLGARAPTASVASGSRTNDGEVHGDASGRGSLGVRIIGEDAMPDRWAAQIGKMLVGWDGRSRPHPRRDGPR